jgi:DNA mismatch repair protein MutS
MLKINLENVDSLIIKGRELKMDDLIFNTNNKNNAKVTVPKLNMPDNKTKNSNNNSDEEDDDEEDDNHKLIGLVQNYYHEELKNLYTKYGMYIKEIIPFIAYVDYLKSNAKTATKYNYKRPIIQNNSDNKAYVKCNELRHPIIERIIDYGYVPHDVDIGDNLKGMLLYGHNGAGKTALMKALGLSIIMAQAGLYVPAKSFIYSPYDMLFTRISGNDNLFKGLSSFTVEMIELKAILKRSGSKTLVIGDEVCRGTEHISGNAIVATTIIKLAGSGSSFIFATHLHEIASMKRITELDNVKSFHISVEVDSKTNLLIYDRIMKPGPGEPIYGVTVAKHIIQDSDFIKLASDIKNELLNEYKSVTTGITSRYNSDLPVDECKLCGKKNQKLHISPLETHHISFQKDCQDGFTNDKPHIKKNDLANLVVLCNECHDKLHNGQYKIDGYVMTSEGKSLQVKVKNKKVIVNNTKHLICE